jgi:hypothetical protein
MPPTTMPPTTVAPTTVALCPPLVISDDDVDLIVGALRDVPRAAG